MNQACILVHLLLMLRCLLFVKFMIMIAFNCATHLRFKLHNTWFGQGSCFNSSYIPTFPIYDYYSSYMNVSDEVRSMRCWVDVIRYKLSVMDIGQIGFINAIELFTSICQENIGLMTICVIEFSSLLIFWWVVGSVCKCNPSLGRSVRFAEEAMFSPNKSFPIISVHIID